jgi:hypothetical protein
VRNEAHRQVLSYKQPELRLRRRRVFEIGEVLQHLRAMPLQEGRRVELQQPRVEA